MDILSILRGSQPQRPVRPNEFSLYWSRQGVLVVGADRDGKPIKRSIIPLAKARELDSRLKDVQLISRFDRVRNRFDSGWTGVDARTGARFNFSSGMGLAFRLNLEARPEVEPANGYGDATAVLADEAAEPEVTFVDEGSGKQQA